MTKFRKGQWIEPNGKYPNIEVYFPDGPKKIVRTQDVNLAYAGHQFVYIMDGSNEQGLYANGLQKAKQR